MELIWILVVIWAVWYFVNHRRSKTNSDQTIASNVAATEPQAVERNYTEEEVLGYQTSFEQELHEQVDFPDGIRGVDLYVFKSLMKPWFQKLVARYRYDDQMVAKVRRDWFTYMISMKEYATTSYLGMETEGEKSDDYTKRARQAYKQLQAIEDGFAASVGEDAEAQIKRIREMDFSDRWDKFSKYGEMAPDGKEYDLSGDLVDSKK